MGALSSDLLEAAEELRETHISWVFLHRELVFKVKKPVNFGFLDFESPEARKQACESEVRLNRRLAPDVYLGVVPVVRSRGVHRALRPGETTAAGSDEEVVDWAVCMRRLADGQSAQSKLRAGTLTLSELRSLAERLARFHSESPRGPEIDRYGEPDAIVVNVLENFRQAHSLLASVASEQQQAEVEERQKRFLRDSAHVLANRVRSKRIVDGHGDLRLEHVYFDSQACPTIIDCIEFNERFRRGDACADVAFLSMDLAHNGRTDLADAFLARYAMAANDYDLYRVVDFYQSYRAYVRAKVAALSLSSGEPSARERQRVLSSCRSHFLLAQASLRPRLESARLIAVGGWVGSGKSTLSSGLADRAGLVRISSDLTRKWLHGAGATERLPADAYDRETTDRVYEELAERASAVLSSGRGVVLDASFRVQSERRRMQELARGAGVPFCFVECRVPEAVARRRLLAREGVSTESDGRIGIFDQFVATYEPVGEMGPGEHLVVDSAGDAGVAVERLISELGLRAIGGFWDAL